MKTAKKKSYNRNTYGIYLPDDLYNWYSQKGIDGYKLVSPFMTQVLSNPVVIVIAVIMAFINKLRGLKDV